MQYLEGETLAARLEREPRLSIQEVLRLGREIAQGLEAAHRQQLIHRDIKPANIWLEAPGDRVKLLDFGLVRPLDDDAHLTPSGFVVGTPECMAPEQATGKPIDRRSDLFSLGCVLYRMSTGSWPLCGSDTMSQLVALTSLDPTPPREINPDLPPDLADLILQLLAKDPAQRPPSAEAVVALLQSIADEHPSLIVTRQVTLAPPAPSTPADQRRTAEMPRQDRPKEQMSQRRHWLLVGIAVVALSVLGVLVYWLAR
jgi:serine/threonine protein kinase